MAIGKDRINLILYERHGRRRSWALLVLLVVSTKVYHVRHPIVLYLTLLPMSEKMIFFTHTSNLTMRCLHCIRAKAPNIHESLLSD